MSTTTAQNYMITGAAGLLGQQVVRTLIKSGHRLCLVGRDEQRLDELQKLAPAQILILPCDLSDAIAAKAAVTYTIEQFGTIHGLAHLVGKFARGPFQASPIASYEEALQTNFFTALNITQPLLPYLTEGASLIYVSSFLAHDPVQNMGAYAVSKAALVTWAKTLAREVRPHARVNILSTTMLDNPQSRRRLKETAHQYLVDAEAMAESVAFLLNLDSSMITGATIPVYNHFQLEDTTFS